MYVGGVTVVYLCSVPEITSTGMAVWKRDHENRRHYHSECGIIESFNFLVTLVLILIYTLFLGV